MLKILKKTISFMMSKVFIVSFLALLHLGAMVLLFYTLADYTRIFSFSLRVLSLLMTLYIIKKDEIPEYKLLWILFITLIPLLGGLFYIFFGNKQPSKRLRKKLEKVEKKHWKDFDYNLDPLKVLDRRRAMTANYINSHAPYPAYNNTAVKYYSLGEDMYGDMIRDLRAAKKTIFMEYFIVAKGNMWEEIFCVLKEKVSEGVDVRLIYDDLGSIAVLPPNLLKECKQYNIKCKPFNVAVPFFSLVMNNRNHRKMLVIDGNISYTGGINISDEYINELVRFGHWKDTGIRLVGEATWNFTVMFLNLWNGINKRDEDYTRFKPDEKVLAMVKNNCVVQPFCDSPLDDERTGENIYIDILNQAEKYVYIFTPYLIINSQMQNALTLAAKRGVDVRIVTPGIPDKKTVFQLTRSYYQPLLKEGVKIFEYSPGFIHAKSFISDDKVGVVGTINMDYRSLYLHFECGVLMFNSNAINEIKLDCIDVFSKSKKVELNDIKSSLFSGLYQAILRLLSPLF